MSKHWKLESDSLVASFQVWSEGLSAEQGDFQGGGYKGRTETKHPTGDVTPNIQQHKLLYCCRLCTRTGVDGRCIKEYVTESLLTTKMAKGCMRTFLSSRFSTSIVLVNFALITFEQYNYIF